MRRTQTITVETGRDKGGVFVIEEMAALPAAEWFIRAMQILARSGTEIPPYIMQLGAAGIATIGIGALVTGLGKAPWHEVKPLLDELLTCVKSYQPPETVMAQTRWDVIKTQIHDPVTILFLHEEVVSLHLGFSLIAKLSTLREMAIAWMQNLGENTETSTDLVPPSYQAASPP